MAPAPNADCPGLWWVGPDHGLTALRVIGLPWRWLVSQPWRHSSRALGGNVAVPALALFALDRGSGKAGGGAIFKSYTGLAALWAGSRAPLERVAIGAVVVVALALIALPITGVGPAGLDRGSAALSDLSANVPICTASDCRGSCDWTFVALAAAAVLVALLVSAASPGSPRHRHDRRLPLALGHGFLVAVPSMLSLRRRGCGLAIGVTSAPTASSGGGQSRSSRFRGLRRECGATGVGRAGFRGRRRGRWRAAPSTPGRLHAVGGQCAELGDRPSAGLTGEPKGSDAQHHERSATDPLGRDSPAIGVIDDPSLQGHDARLARRRHDAVFVAGCGTAAISASPARSAGPTASPQWVASTSSPPSAGASGRQELRLGVGAASALASARLRSRSLCPTSMRRSKICCHRLSAHKPREISLTLSAYIASSNGGDRACTRRGS